MRATCSLAVCILTLKTFATASIQTPTLYPFQSHGYQGVPGMMTRLPLQINNQENTDRPGTCSVWGQGHMRTFDQRSITFAGGCLYRLLYDCDEPFSDFEVQYERDSRSRLINKVILLTETHKVTMQRGNVTMAKNVAIKEAKVLSLPVVEHGLHFSKIGDYIIVRHAQHHLTISWNEKDNLMVELCISYRNKVCGLCGNYNNDPDDEFTSFTTELAYVERHTVRDNECEDLTDEAPKCNITQGDLQNFLRNLLYRACDLPAVSKTLQPRLLEDACNLNADLQTYDECLQNSSCVLCDTIAEAKRYCANKINYVNRLPHNYCPVSCPQGQQYSSSGASCQATCSNPTSSNLCVESPVAGCVCPIGMVDDDIGTRGCIQKHECSCKHRGKVYHVNATIELHCQSCVCKDGKWKCEQQPCVENCKIEGGLHVTTFDDHEYFFTGKCFYWFLKSGEGGEKFDVIVDVRICGQRESCIRGVTLLTDNNEVEYTSDMENTVELNGRSIMLPFSTGNFSVSQQSLSYILISTVSGASLLIHTQHEIQLYLTLPMNFKRRTSGLCGNYNARLSDDMKMPEGILATSSAEFAMSWKTQTCAQPPLDTTMCYGARETETGVCNIIRDSSGVFSDCHGALNEQDYYQWCYDYSCSCSDSIACGCVVIAAFARACGEAGFLVPLSKIDVCSEAVQCPHNLVNQNITSCLQTCRSFSTSAHECPPLPYPIFDCTCPHGAVLSDTGECIPLWRCHCYTSEGTVNAGETRDLAIGTCTCQNGVLNCTNQPDCHHPGTMVRCAQDGRPGVGAGCQQRCGHKSSDCYTKTCVPGCVCPEGMAMDDQNNCIQIERCPCYYKGRSYNNGDTIKQQCNNCTCVSSHWNCTEDLCPGTCAIFGEGHHLTFDGKKYYTFNGPCKYVVAQDACGDDASNVTFRVIAENVPCGSTGTVCTKNVLIIIGNVAVTFFGHTYQVHHMSNGSSIPFQIRHVGMFWMVVAEGLQISWDEKTTLYVHVDPMYKGRLCGLCGNFDGDAQNDFVQNTLGTVTSALDFGNSWAADQNSCPEVNATKDPCFINQERRPWAERRCIILYSETFKPCHALVDPAIYFDMCVSDGCGCDTGGDCECICTVLAAYSYFCALSGVFPTWRTPDICPLGCDLYNAEGKCEWHYRHEGPCMKTCQNRNGVCEPYTQFEGCYPMCPESTPLFDEYRNNCTATCHCYSDDNGEYSIGDPMPSSEDCQLCTCEEEGRRCVSRNCSGSTTPGYTTITASSSTIPSTTQGYTTITASSSTIPSTTQEYTTITTASSTIPSTTQGETTITTASSTIPSTTERCQCEWKEWINIDYPKRFPDLDPPTSIENETYAHIREKNKGDQLCDNPQEIECQYVDDPSTPTDSYPGTFCNVSEGFLCKTTNRCFKDTRIRVCCETCLTTPTVSSTTTVPSTMTTEITILTTTSTQTTETTSFSYTPTTTRTTSPTTEPPSTTPPSTTLITTTQPSTTPPTTTPPSTTSLTSTPPSTTPQTSTLPSTTLITSTPPSTTSLTSTPPYTTLITTTQPSTTPPTTTPSSTTSLTSTPPSTTPQTSTPPSTTLITSTPPSTTPPTTTPPSTTLITSTPPSTTSLTSTPPSTTLITTTQPSTTPPTTTPPTTTSLTSTPPSTTPLTSTPPSTTLITTTQPSTTPPTTTPSSTRCQCEWKEWINIDYPKRFPDLDPPTSIENETFAHIREKNKGEQLCDNPQEIECQYVDDPSTPTDSYPGTFCNVSEGFLCKTTNRCFKDTRIRVCCETCLTTPTVSSTTTVPSTMTTEITILTTTSTQTTETTSFSYTPTTTRTTSPTTEPPSTTPPSTTLITTTQPSTTPPTTTPPSTTSLTSTPPSTTPQTSTLPSTTLITSTPPSTTSLTSTPPYTTLITTTQPSTTPPTTTPSSTTSLTSTPPSTTPQTSTPPSTTLITSTPPSTTPPTTTPPSTTLITSTPPSTTSLTSTPPSTTLITTTQPSTTPPTTTPPTTTSLTSTPPSTTPLTSTPPSTTPITSTPPSTTPLTSTPPSTTQTTPTQPSTTPITSTTPSTTRITSTPPSTTPPTTTPPSTTSLTSTPPSTTPPTTTPPSTTLITSTPPSTTSLTSTPPSTTPPTTTPPSTTLITTTPPSTTSLTSTPPSTTLITTTQPSTTPPTTTPPTTTSLTSTPPSTTPPTTTPPSTTLITSTPPSTTSSTTPTTPTQPSTTLITTTQPSTTPPTTTPPSTIPPTTTPPSTTPLTSTTLTTSTPPSTTLITSTTPSTTPLTSTPPSTTPPTSTTPSTTLITPTPPSTTSRTSIPPSTTPLTSTTLTTSTPPSTTLITSTTPSTTPLTSTPPSTTPPTSTTPSTTPLTSTTLSTTLITSTTPSTTPLTSTTPSTTQTTPTQPSTTPISSTTPPTTRITSTQSSTTPTTPTQPSTTLITTTQPSTTPPTTTPPSTTPPTTTPPSTTPLTSTTPSTTLITPTPPSTTQTTPTQPSTTPITSTTPPTTRITSTQSSTTPTTPTQPSTTLITTTQPSTTPPTTTPPSTTPPTTTPPSTTPPTTTPPSTTPLTSTPPSTTPITSTPPSTTPLTSTTLTTSTPPSTTLLTSTPPSTTPLTSTPPSTTLITSTPPFTTLLTSIPPSTTPLTSTPPSTTLITSTPPFTTLLTSIPPSTTPLTSTPPSTTLITSTPPFTTLLTSIPPSTTPLTSTPPSTTLITSTPPFTTPLTSTRSSTTPITTTQPFTTPLTSTPPSTTLITSTPPFTTPLTSTRSSTTPITTTQPFTTPPTSTPSVPTLTSTSIMTSTFSSSSTSPCYCISQDGKKNVGESWIVPDLCTNATCVACMTIQEEYITCPPQQELKCTNYEKPILVKGGCCPEYECPCECLSYGDPHYVTFDGQYYTFQGVCTYVLVREIQSRHGDFLVEVNTTECQNNPMSHPLSCPKAVMVTYDGNRYSMSTIQVGGINTVKVEVNNDTIIPPYQNGNVSISNHGVTRITIGNFANITFSFSTITVQLLPTEFSGNTEGQCGVCNNNKSDDCRLPSGTVVSSCSEMAREWNTSDCNYLPPPTSTATPTCVPSGICSVLDSKVFEACGQVVNLKPYKLGCQYDQCFVNSTFLCSTLKLVAQLCAAHHICVDWRNYTQGKCPMECPSHKSYSACGPVLEPTCTDKREKEGMIEGCFCPEQSMAPNERSDACVTSCGCIKDGKQYQPDESVEGSDCEHCHCQLMENTFNVTCKSISCTPCAEDETFFTPNNTCCGCKKTRCIVPIYNISLQPGESWKEDNCTKFECLGEEGSLFEPRLVTYNIICPDLDCPASLQRLDENGCCKKCCTTCGGKCTVYHQQEELRHGNCFANVSMGRCHGQCASYSMYSNHTSAMKHHCSCCRETALQHMEVEMSCKHGVKKVLSYTNVANCSCMENECGSSSNWQQQKKHLQHVFKAQLIH
uniref:mucin-2-like n=1 Tax=Myxine glutinosa TaxID=7769 RepID=UPI00358FCFD4